MREWNLTAPGRLLAAGLLSVASVGLAAGAQSGAPQPNPAPASGSMSGCVSDASTDVPVPGVQVSLVGQPGPSAVIFTGRDGCYRFSGLAAGAYRVTFTKAGFVSVHHANQRPGSATRLLDLEQGLRLERVDAVLVRGGAIEGRVVDDGGAPVAEAAVSALRLETAGGQRRLLSVGRTATTDDLGRYRLYGLVAGRYFVACGVRADPAMDDEPAAPALASGEAAGYAPSFFPGVPALSEAQRLAVRPGDELPDVNIVLRRVRFARVSGVLVPEAGAVLDGSYVVLRRAFASASLPSDFVGMAKAGRDGAFGIRAVPPGEYVLNAWSIAASAVEAVARTGRSSALAGAEGAEVGSIPVVVAGADVSGLSIPLRRARHIRGRLMLNGRGYAEAGSRARVQVSAVPSAPDSLSVGPTGVLAAPDGSFDISGVVGTFVLRVEGLPSGLVVSRVEMNGSDVTDPGLQVSAGADVDGVDVLLSSVMTRLDGHVRAGAIRTMEPTVVAFAQDGERWSWPATRYVRIAPVAADGSFRIDGLPPGGYHVAIAAAGAGDPGDPDWLEQLVGGALAVTLEAGERKQVELRPR